MKDLILEEPLCCSACEEIDFFDTFVCIQIRDRECAVVPSEDNDTLFVGNICKTWTSEQVRSVSRAHASCCLSSH